MSSIKYWEVCLVGVAVNACVFIMLPSLGRIRGTSRLKKK